MGEIPSILKPRTSSLVYQHLLRRRHEQFRAPHQRHGNSEPLQSLRRQPQRPPHEREPQQPHISPRPKINGSMESLLIYTYSYYLILVICTVIPVNIIFASRFFGYKDYKTNAGDFFFCAKSLFLCKFYKNS